MHVSPKSCRPAKSLACLLLALGMATPVSADNVTVGNGTPGSCTEASLQAALPILNPGIQGPGGTLTFDCGPNLHTIALTTQIFLSDDSTIDGGARIIIDGQNLTRLFQVGGEGSRVTLANLRMTRGFAANDFGGAVLVQPGAHLIISNGLIASSRAGLSGGAIAVFPGASLEINGATIQGNRARDGGAIASSGPTLVENAEFLDNVAEIDQGGALQIWTTTLTMTNVLVQGNSGRQGGGLLQRGGTSTLTDVQFRNNQASNEGGGFHLYEAGVSEMIRVHFTGNSATSRGGGLFVAHGDPLEAPLYGTNRARLFRSSLSMNTTPGRGGGIASGILPNQLIGGGVVVLDETNVSANDAALGGGLAIEGPLIASGSTIEQNTGIDGAGLHVDNDAGRPLLVLDDVQLLGNVASGSGGAIHVRNGGSPFAVGLARFHASGNRAFNGGGVAVVGFGGTDIVEASLVGNEATSAGGGVFVQDDELDIRNVTFSNNRAIGGMNFAGVGGDVFVRNQGINFSTATIVFSTLWFGDASQGSSLFAEGGSGSNDTRIRIGQSIVQPSPLSGPVFGSTGVSSVSSTGGNIGVALPNCNPCTDVVVPSFGTLGLASLAELPNGTFAHVPASDSPVVDAIDCGTNTRDQAGNPRPAGGLCDRGAIERQSPVVDAVFKNGFE